MLGRFFGKSKPKEPGPTLDDATSSMEARGGKLDERIAALDRELLRFKTQMKKMRKGPARKAVQQRALRVLKQKKAYEKQRDNLYQQQFNIDQTKFAQESLQETATTVAAMKDASKQLKTHFKEVDIDEIEDLHDDMEDLMEQNEEIQEVMGRSYGVPEEFDEDDLLDELEALEGEMELEDEEEVPDYLVSAASAAKVSERGNAEQPEEDAMVDEHGLPRVPQRQLV